METALFEIIASVGDARSKFIEAIRFAKNDDFTQAQERMESGNKMLIEGHQVHGKLITQEASGEAVDISLLLIHAEDQLMSAENFQILANEFIDLYLKFSKEK